MERFSMNEFQPLTLLEKKSRIDDKILEIHNKKHPFITRKQDLEFELSELNDRVKGKELHDIKYQDICKQQRKLKYEKMEIERKLSGFKDEERKLQSERDKTDLSIRRVPDEKAKAKILEIRDKYMSFAADTTRVSSMRAMASRFVEELQSILTDMP